MSQTVTRVLHGPITPVMVFEDSAPVQKFIMLILLVSILAAVVVMGLKLASGRRLSGGSAFLSGLRFGGPIFGLLGACYAGLNMALGIANVPIEPNLKILAPGIAECMLMIGLGVLAGAVAAVAHWIVESRIDRQVLSV